MSDPRAADLQIREYLDRLAAKLPAPGGGSASALVGALGAALAAMVANFTVGQEKFAPVEDDVRRVLEAVEAQRAALLDLIQEDMDAYGEVSAAFKLPKDDPARAEAVQRALKGAAAVPLAIVDGCLAVLRLLPELLEKSNPNLVSDVGVSAELALGAARAAWINAEVNLAGYTDEADARAVRGRVEAAVADVERTASEVRAAVTRKLRG